MKGLIVADSPEIDPSLVAALSKTHDLIVVTDGAARSLPEGVVPHIVCGDFDSLDVNDAQKRYPAAEFILLEDQHRNDFEKALILSLSRGCDRVTAVRALGGRVDIAIANLAVMVRHHTKCLLEMTHGEMVVRVVSGRFGEASTIRCHVPIGGDLSCVAFEGDAVVTLENVAWPLTREVLRSGSHGVSNRAVSGEVIVTVHEGLVIVSHTRA